MNGVINATSPMYPLHHVVELNCPFLKHLQLRKRISKEEYAKELAVPNKRLCGSKGSSCKMACANIISCHKSYRDKKILAKDCQSRNITSNKFREHPTAASVLPE